MAHAREREGGCETREEHEREARRERAWEKAEARKAKMAEKLADRVVETAFYKVGNCRQIPLFDIPKIHKAGRESYDAAMKLPLTAAEVMSMVEARLENEIAKVEVKR